MLIKRFVLSYGFQIGLALSTPKIRINASPTEYTISLYGSNLIKSHVTAHLPLLNEIPKETATDSPEYILICYADETKRYFEHNPEFCEIFKLTIIIPSANC